MNSPDSVNYGFHLFCAAKRATAVSTDNSSHDAYVYDVVTPFRVFLTTGNNSNPMRLIITYTELNQ
jgi:hypothetical protein